NTGEGAPFILHATGTLGAAVAAPSPNDLAWRCDREIAPAEFYSSVFGEAVKLGSRCRRLESIRTGDGVGCGTGAASHHGIRGEILDAGAIDAAVQLVAALVPTAGPHHQLITRVEDVTRRGDDRAISAHAELESFDNDSGVLVARVSLFNREGEVLF